MIFQILAMIFSFIASGWFFGNFVGWFVSYHQDGEPFSWRIWLGPYGYVNWLERS